LRQLPKPLPDPNLLVGTDTSDDGGVYKITDDIALIQSVDYFTPVVDDPYMFGQIAAANSLSDIYAMGGVPKTALNIVGYPMSVLGPDILADILKGAADKVKEAGAVTVGGHSIDDQEPKFGLSVTGIVHPERIYKNVGAKAGDVLVLTKPIGVGIQTTAIKRDALSPEQIETVSRTMAELNLIAAGALKELSPHAVTDVTGFGLLGHAHEMASGSHVTFYLDSEKVPLLEGTTELAEKGMVPGGSKKNLLWLEPHVDFGKVTDTLKIILADAVTSGGLLVSLSQEQALTYIQKLHEQGVGRASIIGTVMPQQDHSIYVK
jgi:selenide,water dikinase